MRACSPRLLLCVAYCLWITLVDLAKCACRRSSKRWQNNGRLAHSFAHTRRHRRMCAEQEEIILVFPDGCANSPPTNELNIRRFLCCLSRKPHPTPGPCPSNAILFIQKYSRAPSHTEKPSRCSTRWRWRLSLEYVCGTSQSARRLKSNVVVWRSREISRETLSKWKKHLNHWIRNLFSPKFKYNLHHCTTHTHKHK